MTQRLPPKNAKRRGMPKWPKRVAHPTPEDRLAYAQATFAHADAISRKESVAVWKDRVKRWHRPEGAAAVEPLKGVRHLTSLKASEGTKAKRCTKLTKRGTPCQMVAVRGMDCCFFHGGATEIARRRILLGIPPLSRHYATGMAKGRLYVHQIVPVELQQLPFYRSVEQHRHKKVGRMGLRRLLLGWLAAEAGDPAAWANAVLEVKKLGF